MNIKILLSTHKQCNVPQGNIYLPIHVGKELNPNKDYGFQPDNDGDNISEKNPYYSELTALYWAWKNLDADYIGLVHYRRFFSLKRKKTDWDSILTDEEAESLCSQYDLILPRKRRLYIETVYSHYDLTFDGKQFDNARVVISEICPEYLQCFDRVMNSRSANLFNMFIMKSDLFRDYCQWLFPILERLETYYDLKNMDPFQARLIGRVSERLLNVWVIKNEIKYKEIGYVYLGKGGIVKKIWGFILAKFFGRKYTKSF